MSEEKKYARCSAATEHATGRYEFPYNRTFQAIAAATSVYAEGVGVNVSVKAFQEAFNSFPDAKPLNEPQAASKMLTMLAILDAAGGQTEASDSKWCWLNYFCNDEPVDTFNQAIDAKLIRVTHDSSFDTSTAFLTDAGRASLALSRPK